MTKAIGKDSCLYWSLTIFIEEYPNKKIFRVFYLYQRAPKKFYSLLENSIPGCSVEGHSYTEKHRPQVSSQSQSSTWKTFSNNWKRNELPARWKPPLPPCPLAARTFRSIEGGGLRFGGWSLTPIPEVPSLERLRKWPMSFDFTLKLGFKDW